jgi:DNA-binding LacI/PurR family transcriptional regulator
MMMKNINKNKYAAVACELEKRILDGFKENRRVELPTQQELCMEMSTSITTVRMALNLLRDKGLISTRQGSGSCSSDELMNGANTIALVVGYNYEGMQLSNWHPLVLSELRHLLRDAGWNVVIYTLFHSNPERDEHAMEQLAADAQSHKFIGLISCLSMSNFPDYFSTLLKELGVYYISFDSCGNHNNIMIDFYGIGAMGAEYLKSEKLRHVGIIAESNGQEHIEIFDDYTSFSQTVQRYPEMERRDEWCVCAQPSIENGIEAFKKIWSAKVKPDGILVTDDVTYLGVVIAMLELGVNCPRDIKIVTQLTEGEIPNSIFNPAWLVLSPNNFAWQAFNTITGMIKSGTVQVPTVRISPRLQK